MSDWSHGYNVSHGYTYGFYRELAPDWLDLCARLAGFVAPSRSASGAFRYLEMGSGQGAGLCMLAAANPDGDFVGIDFNPEHVSHANALAIGAGLTNVRFIEADFADLGAAWPADLGQFDYVVLHGIYSWVPVSVRQALVKCLDHAVPAGGLVYNSYNTKPGWVSTQPFQHMVRRMQVVGALTGAQAIDQTITLFESLEANKSAIFQVLPMLKNRVESVKTQNRNYLIQEYLHDYWYPFWFSEVAEEFASAKLNYVGTATMVELMLPGVLAQETRAVIEKQADPILRQEVQDCAINQSFRRDIFCRGARRGFGAGFELLAPSMLHLLAPAKEDTLKITAGFGELTVKAEVYGPLIEQLSQGPKSFGDLLGQPNIVRQGLVGAVHSIMLLIHANVIGVGRSNVVEPEVAQRFNAAIAAAVSGGAPYSFFAVPTLGSALAASDIDCMLTDSWLKTPECDEGRLVQGLTDRLARLNRSLSHEGKRLEDDAFKERVGGLARRFITESLPRWRNLGALA